MRGDIIKTSNLKMKGDWQDVVDMARLTVGKGELGHEPSESFKKNILIAEHSPIRAISFSWKWENIMSWVATHFSRHKWECFIKTNRSDKIGKNRNELPQGELVTFAGEANIQHLIDTMRKRLCFCASKETREYAEGLKTAIHSLDPEISDVFVPNCIYRGGCPERTMCNFWGRFCNICKTEYNVTIQLLPIEDRYYYYNKYFYKDRIEESYGE